MSMVMTSGFQRFPPSATAPLGPSLGVAHGPASCSSALKNSLQDLPHECGILHDEQRENFLMMVAIVPLRYRRHGGAGGLRSL